MIEVDTSQGHQELEGRRQQDVVVGKLRVVLNAIRKQIKSLLAQFSLALHEGNSGNQTNLDHEALDDGGQFLWGDLLPEEAFLIEDGEDIAHAHRIIALDMNFVHLL